MKEKQAKRKEIRAEQEKKLAQQKKEEEERLRKEEAEKKAKEAEEKRKRLEEAEKKRQAMMQAQKEKQSAGDKKGGAKKTDGGVSVFFSDLHYDQNFAGHGERAGCAEGDDKDKGAAGGGEKDLAEHQDQAPRAGRDGRGRPEGEGQRAVGGDLTIHYFCHHEHCL